jgi:hypothetical protein
LLSKPHFVNAIEDITGLGILSTMLMLRRIAFYGCFVAVASSPTPTTIIRRGDGGSIEIEDDKIFAPPSSLVLEAHFKSINDNNNDARHRSSSPTSSPPSNVYIDCQPDTIIVQKQAEDARGIVRHCTVHTFGPMHGPISLECVVPPSLFPYFDCEMNPEFLIIGDDEQATANDVAAIVHVASEISIGDDVVGDEILVKAAHGLEVQMAVIHVTMPGDERQVNLFEPDTNAYYEPDTFAGSQMNAQADDRVVDYFSFAGQSNSVGHTTSEESISKNGTHWNNLMRLFNESEYIGTSQTWSQRLYDTIQAVHSTATGPESVITLLRDEAMRLQAMGLLNGLNRSSSLGK